LWFYVPLDTKQVISATFPQANLLAWYGKNKPNATKARAHQSNETHDNKKINTKKLKPGLVVFCDIRPENRAGLFSKDKINQEGDK